MLSKNLTKSQSTVIFGEVARPAGQLVSLVQARNSDALIVFLSIMENLILKFKSSHAPKSTNTASKSSHYFGARSLAICWLWCGSSQFRRSVIVLKIELLIKLHPQQCFSELLVLVCMFENMEWKGCYCLLGCDSNTSWRSMVSACSICNAYERH